MPKPSLLTTLLTFATVCAITPLPAQADDDSTVIRLAFTGDVALTRQKLPVKDGTVPWSDNPLRIVAPTLKAADLAIANFEGAMSTIPRGLPRGHLWAPLHAATVFKPAGVDVVSVANNHGFDAGSNGLRETLDALRKTGVHTIGGGDGSDEARKAYIHPLPHDRCLAILPATLWSNIPMAESATTVLAQYNPRDPKNFDALVEQVRANKKKCAFVIVYIHWGFERQHHPHSQIVDLAHRMVEAGADLIVGHHPHVLQGIEFVGKSAIVYSLGNFVFPTSKPHDNPKVRLGGLLQVEIDLAHTTPIRAVSLLPTYIRATTLGPHPITTRERDKLLPKMRGWCRAFGTQVELDGDQLTFFPSEQTP